ncbi:EAL domain-containing protein [Lacticaseibacillus baoqingensis]|uniref:EAL domain-containing protein n=1 Tax=Lacticaseibacillus baoqingensis TaxID=2486013 RepID=A0ABW4E6D9_9LACO|nr:EAL domain-containing protein [Lacticaseibacillus baoqingensis]
MKTYTYFSQAIMDSATREVVGYELLLRLWQAQQKQWCLPKDFEITVKKQMRMMQAVLQTLPVKNVSINLTARQFASPNTMQQLIAFTHSTPALHQLMIELTQAPTLAEVLSIGQQYRQAGISVALDDVGTEITDAALVRQLAPHVDMLKYALQNLRANGQAAKAQAQIKYWQQLALAAGTDFTLEGLESSADVQLASRLGIKWTQGFYFNKPSAPLQTSLNTPLY